MSSKGVIMRTALKKSVSTCVTALVATSLVACASSSKDSSSGFFSGSDTKASTQLRPYQEKTLANGLRVLFLPDESLPYISYSLLIAAGSAQDPDNQSGLSAMVAELLDKGTAKRSAPQIANDLGQMGAEFDASSATDYSIVSASALSIHGDALLSNFTEIALQPAFSDVEIDRVRKQMQAQIERRVDNAQSFAGIAFEEYLYGSHPYAKPVGGTLKGIQTVKKKNIIQQYLRYYRPNNAMLAVVGKYTPELAAKIESAFGSWQKRDVPAPKYGEVPPIKGVQIRLVDKPGLVQAQIRMGHVGIQRVNEDFLALRVANTILGDAFASRLNSRIRKELGLTYDIGSYFDARKDRGPFEISTFTKNASVGQTISETLKLLGEFKAKGVTSEEVDRAKGYLKGVFPRAIETPEKLAFNLLLLRFYGIPDTYLTNYLRDIDRLSASDINKAITKYVDDKNVKVIVYTSAAEAQAQLQGLGTVEVKKASDVQ